MATIEQVVTQLQQELITLKAQVTDQSGLAEAVLAMNSIATAQVRKNAPTLIDVKGLGTGKEEDVQQWSKKAEDFCAGVIEKSEMMLVWSAQLIKSLKSQ